MKNMSVSSHSILQEIRDLLKKNKLRATASRLSVLMVMHEQQGPMTHEEIMNSLPMQGSFDKASIWRVLADLSEIGLLLRMDLGDRIWRYELIDACRQIDAKHAHFLCQDCGLVCCLPSASLHIGGPIPKPMEGIEMQIRVTGRCTACS